MYPTHFVLLLQIRCTVLYSDNIAVERRLQYLQSSCIPQAVLPQGHAALLQHLLFVVCLILDSHAHGQTLCLLQSTS